LALLLLAIPPPTILLNAITMPLQLVASRIAEVLLSSAGVPVFRDGNILELPSTSLEVVEACSGLRSLVSLAAVAIVCGWATRQPPLLRLRLLAATIPIAVIVNGGRIAVTGVMCEIWGPRMAGGEWHTFTGWLTFMTGLVLLLALHRWWAPVDPHTLWDSQLVGA
jgi:exosortase